MIDNPLDDSWKWVESARKDREAAVSQWKAERRTREKIEAENAALRARCADLVLYAEHKRGCASDAPKRGECDCGLAELFRPTDSASAIEEPKT